MKLPFAKTLLIGKVKSVGDPDATEPMKRRWESGIFKESVAEKVWLEATGLSGDEVADTVNHGGMEKAVFAYPLSHYDYWKQELGIADIGIGAMGENLAVSFMDEASVCIGDSYQFGDAVIQVSQPRQPCWKPARRFGRVDFSLRIQQSGRTGWYFRVLQEGFVQAGQELTLLERPCSQWTIAKCNEVMHVEKEDLELAKELVACPFLAENWRQTLTARVAGEKSSGEKRLFGPNKD